MQFLKKIRITRTEARPIDAWYDVSLREMRKGVVNFYKVRDFLTGDWLFKTCNDKELSKVLVKAVKCPAGTRFAQIEGNTMVFQQSQREGWLYDIISLTEGDEEDRVSRKVVNSLDDVPAIIRENYEIKSYQEVTGKKAPGKNLVTLSRADNEKALITLFLLERAWTLSTIAPEDKLATLEGQKRPKRREGKMERDIGQTWKCHICGEEFLLKHIQKEKTARHSLKKTYVYQSHVR